MSWNEIHNITICQPHLLSLRRKKNSKNFLKFITWISHTYCLKHHHALKTMQFILQFISTHQTQLELHHNTNNLWLTIWPHVIQQFCLNIKIDVKISSEHIRKKLIVFWTDYKETRLAFKLASPCHMVPSSHDFLQEEPTISIKWWTAWYTKFSAAPMAMAGPGIIAC